MKIKDIRPALCATHFAGATLKETAAFWDVSLAALSNDRKRHAKEWRDIYASMYSEQIDALKSASMFCEEMAWAPDHYRTLALFHERISEHYRGLQALLDVERLPKKFDPISVLTPALRERVPEEKNQTWRPSQNILIIHVEKNPPNISIRRPMVIAQGEN